jgi:sugar fermentation stimulation protein A
MRFDAPLIRGTLIQRYKRFFVDIRLPNGEIVTAHCTNTGSMLGCNEPGSTVYVSLSRNQKRKLAYTWEIIRIGPTWIGINTLRPNRLIAEAILAGAIDELSGYESMRREVRVSAHSRLDLLLHGKQGRCYVEIKNVTLALADAACFPDAISERAIRHLRELIRLKRRGHRAALVFVVQRGDCAFFRPADEIDPEYGRWLRRAARAGVAILPYVATVSRKEIILGRRLEARL